MLFKNRQDGVVALAGVSSALMVVALFGIWAGSVEQLGVVKFTQGVNLWLYFLGCVAGLIWVQSGLGTVGRKLLTMGWFDALRLSLQQILRITVIMVSLAFATKDLEVSRSFLGGFIVLTTAALTLHNRLAPRFINRVLVGNNRDSTLLVGSPREAQEVGGWIRQRGEVLGVHLAGYLWHEPAIGIETGSSDQPKWLGRVSELRRIASEFGATQVIISQSQFTPEECRRLVDEAEAVGCRVKFFINLKTCFPSHPVAVETEAGISFISLSVEPLEHPVNRLLKRAIDVACALPVVLFVLPPLTVVVWFFQRRQSRGPVYHRQIRSGLNRKRFMIYKFRTMHVHDPRQEGRQAHRGDVRIYAFGAFLRRTSLDELPQFINVLIGDMSVSGPRPHLIEHDEQFAKIVGRYYKRQLVKPGITGLAQSKGFRGEVLDDTVLRQRIGYDMLYISNWSLALDLRILVQTVRQVIFPPKTAV